MKEFSPSRRLDTDKAIPANGKKQTLYQYQNLVFANNNFTPNENHPLIKHLENPSIYESNIETILGSLGYDRNFDISSENWSAKGGESITIWSISSHRTSGSAPDEKARFMSNVAAENEKKMDYPFIVVIRGMENVMACIYVQYFHDLLILSQHLKNFSIFIESKTKSTGFASISSAKK